MLSRSSEHLKPFFRMSQCAAAEQDDVVIGGVRAGEVTAGDVSHGSLYVDMMQLEQSLLFASFDLRVPV